MQWSKLNVATKWVDISEDEWLCARACVRAFVCLCDGPTYLSVTDRGGGVFVWKEG